MRVSYGVSIKSNIHWNALLRFLFGAKPLLERVLFLSIGPQGSKLGEIRIKIFFFQYVFENIVCKMSVITGLYVFEWHCTLFVSM